MVRLEDDRTPTTEEFPMSIHRVWHLTRRLTLKDTIHEGLRAYAESH